MELEITPLIRPFWTEENQTFHDKMWADADITVIICQRKTKDLIQLCLNSLLRFYPDIPILVVDGDSQDDSSEYLEFMALKHKNIQVHTRVNPLGGKHSSHGDTLHEAVTDLCKTKYCLLLDSDVIIERGMFIERMLLLFKLNFNKSLFALGSLMIVSDKNDACGAPLNEDDKLLYSHPSCSMMNVEIYRNLDAPFCNHGAPSHNTMRVAALRGYDIYSYPVERYVSHLSGSSWTEPRTVWNNDHDVLVRPFFTLIDPIGDVRCSGAQYIFTAPRQTNPQVVCHDDCVPITITNRAYEQRLNVIGEYVVVNADESVDFEELKRVLMEYGLPKKLHTVNAYFHRRDYWQRYVALS